MNVFFDRKHGEKSFVPVKKVLDFMLPNLYNINI